MKRVAEVRYQIEDGIPLPEPRSEFNLAETLRKIKPMQSFVVPERQRSSVLPTARRLGIKIQTAKGKKGHAPPDKIRVWRLS